MASLCLCGFWGLSKGSGPNVKFLRVPFRRLCGQRCGTGQGLPSEGPVIFRHHDAAEYIGLDKDQYHSEVYLRYMILQLYEDYGTIILVNLEAPTVVLKVEIQPARPSLGNTLLTQHGGL